jgi:autotransporter-associated beta strand protein
MTTSNLVGGNATFVSDLATAGSGITHTLGNLSLNQGRINIVKGSNVTGGSPSVTFGNVTLTNTGGVTVTFNPTSASLSLANVNMLTTNNTGQTVFLDGTAADNTITGVISNVGGGAGTGKISLTKSNTSTWTLSGANTYNGTTTVSGGILTFLNTTAKSAGSNVTVSAAGTIGLGVSGTNAYTSAQVDSLFANTLTGFTMNATSGVAIDTSGGNFTYATNQSAARALTKLGANTLTLTGANTYSGGTTINAGTLLVNNLTGSGTGSGAVAVNSGGTLGGNGTIGGAVTVNSGGFLSPGNSPGLLTVGSLALNSGSTTTFEINGIAVRGTNYDAIDITAGSGLTLNGTFTINFTNGTALDNTTNINLFGYTGSHTGDFFSLVSTGFYDSGGGSWTHGVGDVWTLSSGGQTLTFSEVTGYLNVVPEPATWALLAFSLTTVMVLRRRRQS